LTARGRSMGLKVVPSCSRMALPIHLLTCLLYRMYRLSTIDTSQTDRLTDSIMMPIADHTASRTIG